MKPTLSEVTALVRSLLMDTESEVYTDAKVLPVLNVAWAEYWDLLLKGDVQERAKQEAFVYVPAYQDSIQPDLVGLSNLMEVRSMSELGVTSTKTVTAAAAHTDGGVKLTISSHAILDNTQVVVVGANEAASGAWFAGVVDADNITLRGSRWWGEYSSGWTVVIPSVALESAVPMSPLSAFVRRAPTATLREFCHEGDRIRLHGATAAQLVRIEAGVSAPAIPVDPDFRFPVNNCSSFLGYRTAALLAKTASRDDWYKAYTEELVRFSPGAPQALAAMQSVGGRDSQRGASQRPIKSQ